MTDLAPWLTPAIVAGVHIWTGALVALGTVVLIHCIRAIAEDWPDTTTPEEDAEQMAALSRPQAVARGRLVEGL